MAALYVMIPAAMALVALAIWFFFWAVDSGQFDDLDSPAHSILFDDTDPVVEQDEAPPPGATNPDEPPHA
jgi:cbb3-type cytochrome oxidase maturation protein